MQEHSDVKLHVWRLQSQSSNFLTRLLPTVGMAPYHTSLEVFGTQYSFSVSGITQSSSGREGVPLGAEYEDEIDLGACAVNKGKFTSIIASLRESFGAKKYHLVHRNCNHFTETLATAIILYDDLQRQEGTSTKRLQTYPEHINRLANTSKLVVGTGGDDIVSCNILEEAKLAVGVSPIAEKTKGAGKPISRNQRKQLTESQKKALAKLKR